MPADEATRAGSAGEPRARTGPRHAAPRKALFTRFHMPAGKAIALAAMPTAVLMGMGLTPTLALADDPAASSRSLTADEYQQCVEALEGAEEDEDASPSPSASADASDAPSPSASSGDASSADGTEPKPSASAGGPGGSSSSDSGSDDEDAPAPAPTGGASGEGGGGGGATAEPEPTPSASQSSKNPLDPLGLGDLVKDILTPGKRTSATPTPSASASADGTGEDEGTSAAGDTADKATGAAKDSGAAKGPGTAEESTDKAGEDGGAGEAGDAADGADGAAEPGETATAEPSPSASASASASADADAEDCPVATDEEGGVERIVALPDDPWYLDASSLLLKGADYKGVVQVRTANGTVKKVLKYVISDGTDIGDLHQTVKDARAGKTYHVQAAKGSTSTIRDGETIMYTESISGKLLGLIPVTFSPDSPPPLNIPLIYFTDVKVVQAGQFGGTLTIPGLHQYID